MPQLALYIGNAHSVALLFDIDSNIKCTVCDLYERKGNAAISIKIGNIINSFVISKRDR